MTANATPAVQPPVCCDCDEPATHEDADGVSRCDTHRQADSEQADTESAVAP